MGRTLPRRDSTLGSVRRYLGLAQWELAGYLRLMPETYRHLEAERRFLTTAQLMQLLPLLRLIPAAPPPGPVYTPPPPLPEPPPPGPPEDTPTPEPLEARLDYCRHHAARLRREAKPYAEKARAQAHRVAALAALAAVAATPLPEPPASEPPTVPTDPATNPATAAAAHRWLVEIGPAIHPYELAEWHLLRAAATGLEAEAEVLAALLGGG